MSAILSTREPGQLIREGQHHERTWQLIGPENESIQVVVGTDEKGVLTVSVKIGAHWADDVQIEIENGVINKFIRRGRVTK